MMNNNYKHKFIYDWAEWFAIDSFGVKHEFECKPNINDSKEHWNVGKGLVAVFCSTPLEDVFCSTPWEDSLQKREKPAEKHTPKVGEACVFFCEVTRDWIQVMVTAIGEQGLLVKVNNKGEEVEVYIPNFLIFKPSTENIEVVFTDGLDDVGRDIYNADTHSNKGQNQ